MADLNSQLAQFAKPWQRLPASGRLALAIGAALLVAVIFAASLLGKESYQYAFTNLGTEDSAEVAEHLKAAGIPFRVEAGGGAVSVPAQKVYDARLLLAAIGLPRGGGVGFELFDRGDIGVSEFTQKVNLQRATEGELARTIGHLAGVRSARVHLTFENKALFREDEHKAAAAVVINLQPGRSLEATEIEGIRHLVASSVPGLTTSAVTLVDGRGRSLSGNSDEDSSHPAGGLERTLEQRVVALLETVVGTGAVVVRVNATIDDAEVTTSSEIFDPDSAALRTEHKVAQSANQDSAAPAGVAGAAGNQPLTPTPPAPTTGSRSANSTDDQSRTYELSKTVTHTVKRSPRLTRLSAAVLIDGAGAKPRTPEEIARLGELAKRAIGFDATRGDVFEITSEPFLHSGDEASAADAKPTEATLLDRYKWWAVAGGGLLLLGAVLAFALRRKPVASPQLTLRSGLKISELERGQASGAHDFAAAPALPVDPALAIRSRALELTKANPTQAAHLLRAWIAQDADGVGGKHG